MSSLCLSTFHGPFPPLILLALCDTSARLLLAGLFTYVVKTGRMKPLASFFFLRMALWSHRRFQKCFPCVWKIPLSLKGLTQRIFDTETSMDILSMFFSTDPWRLDIFPLLYAIFTWIYVGTGEPTLGQQACKQVSRTCCPVPVWIKARCPNWCMH